MGVPGNANALLLRSAAGGYQIERSLRFNSSDSAFLSRTPAVAGNRRTWTWAGWIKRGRTTSLGEIFFAAQPFYICFTGSNSTITSPDRIALSNVAVSSVNIETTSVFRDFSAWFHLVVALDTTQTTPSDRVKIYVNGQLAAISYAVYPSLSEQMSINSTLPHGIGRSFVSSGNDWDIFSGYLADIHFIDGQALTPSSFTEVSATTGQLIPKAYTGSFGTNGFWLKFSDNSAATATTIGKDYSGNSNNWTPNNLSVTAGAGNDSLVDTPTSYGTDAGAGGEVRGNYCTLNPLSTGGSTQTSTLSNGNLDFTSTSGSGTYANRYSTFAVSSGKWYAEFTLTASTNSPFVGVTTSPDTKSSYIAEDSDGWAYFKNGTKWNSNSSTAYGASWTVNDVIGVALDIDSGTLVFYKNGVSQGTAYSGLPAGSYFFGVSGTPGEAFTANFGQRPFAYAAPSGFKALCDTNLTAPVVAKPNTVMDVVRYTGTGANATIPNVNTVPTSIAFTPDLVWIKGRSGATDHALYDLVRGVQKDLVSNSTAAETTQTTGLTAFGTNTFDIGTLAKLNTNTSTYVAWCWDAGSDVNPTTNTQGSITSSVRANASAGFSIVSFSSGSAGNYTVGHGLGAKPHFIITKARNGSTFNWSINHISIATTVNKYLTFTTNATLDNGAAVWGANLSDTNSTTFGISSANAVEANKDCIAYCFAPVAGYSSFGSYTGNGSSDGVFQWCGFRPRWILLKSTGANGASWTMFDTARSTYNQTDAYLFANASGAEGNAFPIDILSNGFKLRTSDGLLNSSSFTYVWAAFAESPFQYARAR